MLTCAVAIPLAGLLTLWGLAQDAKKPEVKAPAGGLPTRKVADGKLPGAGKADPGKKGFTAAASPGFDKIQPFLTKHCVKCHETGKDPQAGVALNRFKELPFVQKERKTWEKVLGQLRAHAMPPEDQPKPPSEDVMAFATWIETELERFDCTGPRDPGRVTIRRLNKAEYNNTIRDLLGIKFTPADDFPSDDVGYGFDNIGDVLSLPPVLMEKYLAAADKIAQSTILTGEAAKSSKKRFEAEKIGHTTGGPAGDGFNLFSTGEVFTEYTFPGDGEYTLRAKAYGQQAGPEPCRMAFKIDDKELNTVDVTAVENSPKTYEFKTKVTGGKHKVALAFLNDFYDAKAPNPNARDRNLVIDYLEVVSDRPPELPEHHRRVIFVQPSDKKPKSDAAREIIERFAGKAFRRPATADEVKRLLGLFELTQKNGDPFETGIQLALQGALVSPHFLFRIESDSQPNDPGASHPITDYELATRLSYFLWSSMPDDTLFDLAKQGTLRKNGNLEAQVRRMLKDPKAIALTDNFAGQWLQFRNLKQVAPNRRQFPSFDDALRTAMAKETEQFFAAIVREDRSILDFLDADFTYLNERLAKHYGIEGVKGDEFQRVSLKGDQRGGVLTHASVLTVTSNPTRTSPVKRGKWILEQILGAAPPPPPPNVPELSEDKKAVLTGSLRQRMEQHRANPACASCHARMDPLGFGFENYDAIGSWRQKDGKFDIDPSGTLPSGKTFKGPAELKTVLKERSQEFSRCLAEKMLTYALGRGLEYYDKCAVDQVVSALEKNQHKFSSLVISIVNSDPFQKRRGDGGEP